MKSVFSVGRAHRWRCLFLVLVVIVFLRLAYTRLTTVKLPEHWYRRVGPEKNSAYIYWVHDLVVKDYLSKRAEWATSNLGTLLFKDQRKISKEAYLQNGHYTVLIWKVGPSLEARHIFNYGTKRSDPLEHCSVQNCDFTYEDSAIDTADAVVIHLHKDQVPNITYQRHRKKDQRWIFLTDESPEHTFLTRPANTWMQYVGIFNWSMSYRTDSDIPVPYGRVVPLQSAAPPGQLTDEGLASLVPHWHAKRRDALVAILISNCSSRRMKFVQQLMRYMTVHVYGKCSKDASNVCPGHFHSDCPDIDRYYFYLSLENSCCYQYMTEKIFYNAYSKGAIPVILGPDNDSAKESLPPYSYIYAENYDSNAEKIANVLINLGNNEQEMLAYHSWRHHFEVLNEHGYFKTRSVHYCRVCEALNYNDKAASVYNNERLGQFLDPKDLCKKLEVVP